MESNLAIDVIDLSREEKLLIFLSRSGLTFKAIGAKLDMTGGALSKICKGETMPTKRHESLLKLGIPATLLPEPKDIKPGPRSTRSAAPVAAVASVSA